eukprot:474979-Pyramimonas_sp.AAC.2
MRRSRSSIEALKRVIPLGALGRWTQSGGGGSTRTRPWSSTSVATSGFCSGSENFSSFTSSWNIVNNSDRVGSKSCSFTESSAGGTTVRAAGMAGFSGLGAGGLAGSPASPPAGGAPVDSAGAVSPGVLGAAPSATAGSVGVSVEAAAASSTAGLVVSPLLARASSGRLSGLEGCSAVPSAGTSAGFGCAPSIAIPSKENAKGAVSLIRALSATADASSSRLQSTVLEGVRFVGGLLVWQGVPGGAYAV